MNNKQNQCLGCLLLKKGLNESKGLIVETKSFYVHQDIETPIPGFLIFASKKHIQSVDELSEKEKIEDYFKGGELNERIH